MQENRSALLVMDVQKGIVSRFVQSPELMIPFQKAVHAARHHQIPVIFVRVAFRPGYPEISPHNQSFATISKWGGMTTEDAATEIDAAVAPQPGEPIVTKLRVSAFTGSDLAVILRGMNIQTLVLSGIATSGVVLSTVREAADQDYSLVVLSDACLDGDPEVHRVLVEKIFPRQASVQTADQWISALTAAGE